ncbi:MAG: hypothetical protein IIZ87_04575, partial [Selenomonas sp.]|nr:hypothetical protein [Selenomonas sp.]
NHSMNFEFNRLGVWGQKGGEEALLRCQQHFSQDYQYTFQIQKWFGVPKVIVGELNKLIVKMMDIRDCELIDIASEIGKRGASLKE